MTKGGKRLGAGRPKTFTPTQLLALANEVTLLMKTGLSASKALKQLQRDGYIKPQTRDRYLGRKYVNQRAKLSRLGVETASNSFHLRVSSSGVLAGGIWSVLHGYYCRDS